MSNSKTVGGSFERQIAKFLSLQLTDGKDDHAVYRTHSSGAVYTMGANDRFEGDIYQIYEKGFYPRLDDFFDMFVIECKHRKKLSFQPPFIKDFLNIVEDINVKYSKSSKLPLLIIGANGKKPIYFVLYNPFGVVDYDIILNIKEKGIILYGYMQDSFKKILEKNLF